MIELDARNRFLLGITLFSMFFGAGNLIFPPFLGSQAGDQTRLAFFGFAASAIVLPILGVTAVTKSGGLKNLTSRVNKNFSTVYILILYLAIGPFLAIPRTASTSFSMAVVPFGHFFEEKLWLIQLLYSVAFFTVASCVALHPEELTEYLGKKLTPILLVLIITIFVMTLIHPAGKPADATQLYRSAAPIKGFLEGYQTMDTLAALNFGMIVAMNIRAKGIQDERMVMKETIYSGWIAGGLLLAVYGMLAYVGMTSSQRFVRVSNGSETLTKMVSFLFGKAGSILLAVVFVIACFNTCVGLLSCCGKYFHSIFQKISYRNWIFLFAFVSMVISNIGLNAILSFSVPVLNAIYPIAILLIFLSCIHHRIEKYPYIYPCSVLFCGAASITAVLEQQKVIIPMITGFFEKMPAYEVGFGWIVPTMFGLAFGMMRKRK